VHGFFGTTSLWNLETRQEVRRWKLTLLPWHSRPTEKRSLGERPRNPPMGRRDRKGNQPDFVPQRRVQLIQFLPDGKSLLTHSSDKETIEWICSPQESAGALARIHAVMIAMGRWHWRTRSFLQMGELTFDTSDLALALLHGVETSLQLRLPSRKRSAFLLQPFAKLLDLAYSIRNCDWDWRGTNEATAWRTHDLALR